MVNNGFWTERGAQSFDYLLQTQDSEEFIPFLIKLRFN